MPRNLSLRPRGADDLGLRRAPEDRLVPVLVAAMAFLAALALAGSAGAAALVRHWQSGAAAAITVQVPHPDAPVSDGTGSRVERAIAVLRGSPGIVSANALSPSELSALLRPWLGASADLHALPLPAVIRARTDSATASSTEGALQARLDAEVPDSLVESHGVWVGRLAILARSVHACAWLALGVVALVAAVVIALATRAGLSARREAIEIVHGLGATDGYIARRFAARAAVLAALGGVLGAAASVPLLLELGYLVAPFAARAGGAPEVAPAAVPAWAAWLQAWPAELALGVPMLPLVAAAIGFATAHLTVRQWLRRLP